MTDLKGLLEVHKSNYLPDVDRMTLAQSKDLYWQVETEGIFGQEIKVPNKKQVYESKREPGKEDPEDEQVREDGRKKRAGNLNLLRADGAFKAGQEEGISQWNLRRLEQRLVIEQRFNYFDQEGDLVVDQEFFEEKIQRIMIIDYDENVAFQTHQRSAARCARENQNKQLPFRLDIYIGVLQFTFHPKFNREDQYISDLRYLIKKYKQRADLALIPHYKKTINILLKEQTELQNRPDDTKNELIMIQNQIQILQERMEGEKNLLQKIMEQVYTKWELVKEERKVHDYIVSPYKLGVRSYRSNENTDEIEFILQKIEVSETTNAKLPISRVEMARRNEVREFGVLLELIINNQVVARTREVRLNWPTFEARFMEKVQVYVFTKPSTIKLRIVAAGFRKKVIDEVEVEVPGEKSNSITSSGFVLKEAYFASGREQIRKTRYKNLIENPIAQAADLQQEAFEGFISYRTEWPDFGPKMPPESLDMQYQQLETKYEDELGEAEEKQLLEKKEEDVLFDINDPRSETKPEGNKMGAETVNSECLVPYGTQISKRQQLLKLRFVKPQLGAMTIPMLEEMIDRNPELLAFLEEEDEGQNYDKELRMQSKQGQFQILEDFITDQNTQKRLLDIQNCLQQRRIESKLRRSKSHGGLMTLENVVNEFQFAAAASLLAECIKSIFTKRRKLGPPKRSVLEKKSVASISEVQVSVLIVQGNNVPIRTTSYQGLHEIKSRISSNKELQNTLQQMLQLEQVSPAIKVTLDLASKNVYIIKNIEKEMKVDRKEKQSQIQVFGMDEDQKEEIKYEQIRVAEDKEANETTPEVKGINPEWNALIDFKIGRERENLQFDPTDVINSRNKLVITLYDQTAHTKQKSSNTVQIGIDQWYIGSITIPLLNLFQQDTINGTFRINRPLLLLNYRTLNVQDYLNEKQHPDQSKRDQINLHSMLSIVDPHVPTTIELTMTLDPQIKVNEDMVSTTYFPGAESTNLFLYGIRQLNRIKQDFKSRYIKFWGENLKGESVFLPRFLHPIQPPQMDFTANPIEKAARFVSLIPFKNDTEAFNDLPDIYCSAQEFVDLRSGDFEEHAILLCCFFMYIDQQVYKREDIKNYVVMGRGLPEGKTQYVMRRTIKTNLVELWNPQTGEPFLFQNEETVTKLMYCFTVSRGFKNLNEIDDLACPLKSIGCVYDDKNIYLNIQDKENPSELNFNIDDHTCWEPFLNEDQRKAFFPKGMVTIQNEVQFDPPSTERAIKVQQQLERFLEAQLEDYRRNSVKVFGGQYTTLFVKQRYAEMSTYIRDVLLMQLESFKYKIRTTGIQKIFREPDLSAPQQPQQSQENQQLLQEDQQSYEFMSYQESLNFLQKQQLELMKRKDKYIRSKEIYGFPLNFSYIDNQRAWDEIKATGIGNITNDELEYLCIVKCFPYPHYVLSCWVFIAVLYKPRAIE